MLWTGCKSMAYAGAEQGLRRGIARLKQVPCDRSKPKPQVLIVGEYLLNFHPGANREIEAYLEKNGFEIIEAHMTDVIRKSYFSRDTQNREFHLHRPLATKAWYHIANTVFEGAHALTEFDRRSPPAL